MQCTQAIEAFLLSMTGVAARSTLVWYRKRLKSLAAFLGEADVGQVTVGDLRRWRVSLCERESRYQDHPSGRSAEAGGLSQHTLHGYVRAARRLFKWLEDEGMIERNPARRLELPKLPKGRVKGIEHENLKKMLAAAEQMGKRELALCWFFYSTGARLAGVVGVRLRDLHLDAGLAYVTEKGNKTRPVFLIQSALRAMVDYLKVRPDSDDDHVFLGLRGPLKGSGVYQVLERIAEQAGVPDGWNPHNWRHRRLRDLQAAGVSMGIVSQIAGHSSIEVTVGIYGVQPVDVLKKAAQIDLPFLSPGDI